MHRWALLPRPELAGWTSVAGPNSQRWTPKGKCSKAITWIVKVYPVQGRTAGKSKTSKNYTVLFKLSPEEALALNKHRPNRLALPYMSVMRKQVATQSAAKIDPEKIGQKANMMRNIIEVQPNTAWRVGMTA